MRRLAPLMPFALLGLVALLPLVVQDPYWLGVLILSMYFALISSGWNLLAGYTGQFSLAPATFAMLGAYTTGLACQYAGAPPWLGIVAAVAASSAIGALLALVVMRLSGPYLALTTLSFAEIARLVIANSYNFTRGDLGLGVPGILQSRVGWYYLFLGAVVVVVIGLLVLLRSPVGLYLRAIRDDEVAAASRGVDVVVWKTVSFTLSSAVAGLAGALYAHFAELISPEIGLLAQTGLVICMVVIGGMGTILGPIAGAFLVYLLSEVLREVGGVQLIVFAVVVIVFARFFREGLAGLARRAAA
ncbi:MAG: branched-chain amino acid ABC transporter permease [Myxococcales bacterium]